MSDFKFDTQRAVLEVQSNSIKYMFNLPICYLNICVGFFGLVFKFILKLVHLSFSVFRDGSWIRLFEYIRHACNA